MAAQKKKALGVHTRAMQAACFRTDQDNEMREKKPWLNAGI